MSIRSSAAVLVLAGTTAVLIGCKKTNTLPTSATPAAPVVSVGPPVTNEEALDFGKRFAKALKTKNRSEFDKVMRMDEFWERCIQDFGVPAKDRAALAKGMSAGTAKFFADLTSICDNGGELVLLGARANRGRVEVVIRATGPEGTNYFVCTPARFPDGSIAMEDMLSAMTGEPMSLTLRRLMIAILQPLLDSRIRLPQKEQEFLNHMATSRAATQALREKEYAKTLELLRTLPRALQDDKQFVLIAVMAGQGVGEAEYMKEIERFMKLFPGDPALDLMTLDYWLAKGEWQKGLESIDRLDAFVGGDPYLEMFRVQFWIKADRLPEAKVAAEKLLSAEPKLLASYNMMALYQVKAGELGAAVSTFKQAIAKFGALDLDTLSADPDFSEFCKSKEFDELKKWAAARGR